MVMCAEPHVSSPEASNAVRLSLHADAQTLLSLLMICHQTLPQSKPAKPSSNLHSTKPDHPQGLVFEHWSNGKPPATIAGSKTNATHKCGVEDCDKAFVNKSDLVRHLQTHKSGPRTYDCLAEGCPRRGLKGFWRVDKFKNHMDRKHPEIEFERYFRWDHSFYMIVGYRDVEKREQHEALMRSKGYKPLPPGSRNFYRMSDAEMAVARLTSLRNDAPW